jgi:acyl carrier protein
MQSDEIKEKLTPIFHDVFGDDSLVVTEDLTAEGVPAWDSLSHVNLIVAVEKAFNLNFSIRDVRALKNVGGLIELVKKKA